jgi:hypothetical protein
MTHDVITVVAWLGLSVRSCSNMTIPTLALTGFALCFAFLALAASEPQRRRP